jgi:bifunctional DNA-binding transcriptional regulator/antitoxin component of YhaV-PrlF toxin-antitoxin module
MDGDHMEAKIARRHQVTIPEEICELAKISIGDTVEISCKHGKLVIEKIEGSWDTVMNETRGAWSEHPVFKDIDDAVEIVNWMRGKE